MGFTKLGLSDQLLQGVRSAGYETPTPIQTLAIRPVLEGKDVIGCAQTGTGKTAAFVLPILDRISQNGKSQRRHPRCLVLTPTRELALQVHNAFRDYGKHTSVKLATVYGGVGMEPQIRLLGRGVDVVVATPGRLLDLMQRSAIDLSLVETMVLDEADRMLDMGFINDVKKILQRLPAERQTLLFSATISDEISALARQFLKNPEVLTVGERRNPAETVVQHFYSVRPDMKAPLLLHILEKEKMESVLVFSRTKHGADKIARRLGRKGISSSALHSNLTQGQRQRALDGFKEGRHRVLVATDIAARGIDVEGISHVVNYDIPRYAEDYIHRIGRTGRAGASGDAITLVGPEERQFLKRIETFVGKRLAVAAYPGFVAEPEEASERTETHGRTQETGSRPERGRMPKGRFEGRPDRRTHNEQRPDRFRKSNTAETTPGQGRSDRRDSRGGQPQSSAAAPRSGRKQSSPFNPRARHGGSPQNWNQAGKKRRSRGGQVGAVAPRKKSAPKKFSSFSSDRDGGAWSNH